MNDLISITRRGAVGGLSAGTVLAFGSTSTLGTNAQAVAAAGEGVLWYGQPAAGWVEALPVGNGWIGAMVHGGTDHERLQLNEDTLWAGGPYVPVNPDALGALPEVRRLIFDGKFAEAQALVGERMMAMPIRQMSYGTMGTLVLTRPGAPASPVPAKAPAGLASPVTPATPPQPIAGYRRDLDLDTAIAATRWSRDGVTYTREVIASPGDQVIAIRLRASAGGRIDIDLSLEVRGAVAAARVDGAGELSFTAGNAASHGIAGALRSNVRIRAVARGGSVGGEPGRLVVRGADELLILIAMATSYRRFDDVGGDPEATTRSQIEAAAKRSFASIAKDATAEHRRLFRRVSLDLGHTPAADLPTDRRIRAGDSGDDRALAVLYFNYARYLLISCSRPGGQPANLQGMWNDTDNPPWGGKYTVNINTEMNYWPAEPTGLPECVEPLIAMVRDLAVTGAHTAKVMYGARGWVCHHNTDLWRATAPIDGANFGTWPTGGAWLCTHLWDHYDYGRDTAYLAQVYPLMRDAALFFVDVLQHDPTTGFLVTNPAMSPENNHGHGSSLCAGPTMDMAILRDLFAQTARAAAILGLDAELAQQFLDTCAKLAPFKVGRQGQLQEWQQDWDADAVDIHHRHVSHLYGVYPSNQISAERTPDLAAAARRSLDIRGDEATGWATAWRIALWARLRDGNHAHHILRFLIGPARTYPNMFDAHPPFQIDGNFGGAAAIAEMLVSSGDDQIMLLPALPDAWPRGTITGIRTRGACTVSVTWDGGRLVEAMVRSAIAGRQTIRCGTASHILDLRAGQTVRLVGPGLRRA